MIRFFCQRTDQGGHAVVKIMNTRDCHAVSGKVHRLDHIFSLGRGRKDRSADGIPGIHQFHLRALCPLLVSIGHHAREAKIAVHAAVHIAAVKNDNIAARRSFRAECRCRNAGQRQTERQDCRKKLLCSPHAVYPSFCFLFRFSSVDRKRPSVFCFRSAARPAHRCRSKIFGDLRADFGVVEHQTDIRL